MPTSTQKNLVRRSPVIVVMGHIDHGKSSLLDYIRKSNIVAGEAGGITQHVGAYQVEHITSEGKKCMITFLDTPGHEAFCSIRERGAQEADIAILVVSAEDGVKPQTIEAYKNIMKEKIPFIVAISKIDKPNADLDRTKQSLSENEIYVEGWGGDIPCVAISSVAGTGIPELLDMVMLVSDLGDFKTDPAASAEGIVVESKRNAKTGVSATLLIKNGTLRTGSFVVSGSAYAPIRFIEDFKGDKIKEATASMPVVIIGWDKAPRCGLPFSIVKTKKEAEKKIEEYIDMIRSADSKSAKDAAIVDTTETSVKDTCQIITLPIIIKADTIGSLEGIKHELSKITHDKVHLEIVSERLGEINENDVKTAISDPNIMIIGFNADPDKKAAAMIERASTPINVKNFSIIYELVEYISQAFTAKIPKEYIEETLGKAKILAIFSKEKDRQVIGGKVQEGTLTSGATVKIMRRDNEIGRGKIRELQSKKQRVDEVAIGFECGMMIEAKIEIAIGDKIEAVRTIEKL